MPYKSKTPNQPQNLRLVGSRSVDDIDRAARKDRRNLIATTAGIVALSGGILGSGLIPRGNDKSMTLKRQIESGQTLGGIAQGVAEDLDHKDGLHLTAGQVLDDSTAYSPDGTPDSDPNFVSPGDTDKIDIPQNQLKP
jgi:hypothetical protein